MCFRIGARAARLNAVTPTPSSENATPETDTPAVDGHVQNGSSDTVSAPAPDKLVKKGRGPRGKKSDDPVQGPGKSPRKKVRKGRRRAGAAPGIAGTAAPSVVALRRLLRHWILVPIALLLAVVAGAYSGWDIQTSPLKLTERGTSYGYAAGQLLIDSERSRVGDVNRQIAGLSDRAEVFTSLMTSDSVRTSIAGRMRIPVDQVSARVIQTGIPSGDNSEAQDQLDAISQAATAYRLTFQAERRGPNGSIGLPLITVTGQAPTAEKATKLVNTAGDVARTYFTGRAASRGVKARNAARATPVGRARGTEVLTGTNKAMAIFVGVAVFLVLCGVILALERFIQDWSAAGYEARGAKRDAASAREVHQR